MELKSLILTSCVLFIFAASSCQTSMADKNAAKEYLNLGNQNFNRKKYDAAVEAFHHAIQLNEEDDQAYYSRGYTYYFLYHYQKAKDDFDTVIRLTPENGKAYYYRALCNIELNNEKDIISDFQKAEKYTREQSDEISKSIHDTTLKSLKKSKIDLLP